MAEENKKLRVWVFVAGFIAAVVCFAVENDIAQRVTTSQFCGTTCHEMDGVYRSWKASPLYANDMGSVTHCADCHLPPQKENHLWFGFLWYCKRNEQRALLEFRLARGSDRTLAEMRKFYTMAPPLPR